MKTQVWFLGREDPLEKETAAHSSILAGESHGQRNLAGFSAWDCKESNMTDRLTDTYDASEKRGAGVLLWEELAPHPISPKPSDGIPRDRASESIWWRKVSYGSDVEASCLKKQANKQRILSQCSMDAHQWEDKWGSCRNCHFLWTRPGYGDEPEWNQEESNEIWSKSENRNWIQENIFGRYQICKNRLFFSFKSSIRND